jgi:hypothetical protein
MRGSPPADKLGRSVNRDGWAMQQMVAQFVVDAVGVLGLGLIAVSIVAGRPTEARAIRRRAPPRRVQAEAVPPDLFRR